MTRSSSSSSSSSYPPPQTSLIPGLPDDVASLILSFIPYSYLTRLKQTCRSWRLFLSSKTLISTRRANRSFSHLLCIFPEDPCVSNPYLFDPQTLGWWRLPPMPCNPNVYALCNFTAVAVGHRLYVIGGSHFDARSFPIDRPTSCDVVFSFDFISGAWEPRAPMLSPRGSFACAKVPGRDQIVVAGGGSRHTVFSAAGSRMSSVERYDIGRNEWVGMEGMPGFRAGCVGFFVGDREFWVMGGYGELRTIREVVPVDEYRATASVMEMNNVDGGKWRETGDMWRGERMRLGKIVVMDNEVDPAKPGVFMLADNDILRYDMSSNRWGLESHVPRKPPCNSSFGFVALDGELHVITYWKIVERLDKRAGRLIIQVYHPQMKSWRSIITRLPFRYHLDFKSVVMSTICL